MFSLLVQIAVLSLQCEGTSTIAVQTTGQTNVWAGGASANANSIVTSTARQSDRVLVEVDGETVRVRPPASMAPQLGGNGSDGWRTLSDVTVDERRISGRFSYNWINRPTVTINRMTGDIEILGSNKYSGVCSRVTATEPLF